MDSGWVALLRGINVGGRSVVPMAGLRKLFEDAGFESVRSYINSGNVLFEGAKPDRVALEQAVQETFGVPSVVVLRTFAELRKTASSPPFGDDVSHTFVGFLADKPAEDIDVLFLAPSADLEYLTGIRRDLPSFGESSYAHGWVTGAFFRAGADPVFVLPRMFVAFHLLDEEPPGELVVVNETDDGFATFERVARGLGEGATVAVGDRVWAEAALNLGRIVGFERLRTGSALVHEVRRVKAPEELDA